MVFANIEYLFLLLLLIPYIVWYILKQKKSEATLQISDARVYAHTPKSYKNYLLHVPFLLRCIALVLVILVLARPQTTNKWQNSEIEGIDIMLAIDVSTSMLAEDLKPNICAEKSTLLLRRSCSINSYSVSLSRYHHFDFSSYNFATNSLLYK